MPVIQHGEVAPEPFRGGATYQTLVGTEDGTMPVRIGIQTSPPGYRTPLHSHPYLEVITVLEGAGEAWIEGSEGTVAMQPGVTLVLPAGVRHWFATKGDKPLKTFGVHASTRRIVDVHDDVAAGR